MGEETAKKLWFLMAGRNLARMSEVGLQPKENCWPILIQKATYLDKRGSLPPSCWVVRGLPLLPAVG